MEKTKNKQLPPIKVKFENLDPIYMLLTLAAFILSVYSMKVKDVKAFILSFILCLICANLVK